MNMTIKNDGYPLMRLNAKELIAEARVTATTLPPAAAKVMSDMADRLDVTFVALRESMDRARLLAAESSIHLQSAARELNTSWMMHKTMMGAQAALLCLSQGDIRSARDWLEGTTDEAFVEMPDDMTPAGLQAWFDKNMTSNDGNNGFLTQEEALERLRQRAPATESFLAALRAEGVEMLAEHLSGMGIMASETSVKEFAAQIRESVQVKGVQS